MLLLGLLLLRYYEGPPDALKESSRKYQGRLLLLLWLLLHLVLRLLLLLLRMLRT